MAKKVEVDTKTFIRFWLVIAALVILLTFIRAAFTGLLLVGISIFLAIAIHPLAQKIGSLDKKKKHPKLTAGIAYSLIIVVIAFAAATIAPVVINETTRFASEAPAMFEETFGGWNGVNEFGRNFGIDNLQEQIRITITDFANSITANLSTSIFSSIGTIANIATGTILVLVLTLLFSLEGPDLVSKFWRAIKRGRGKQSRRSVVAVEHTINRMANVISTYVSRQVMVGLLDGCVVTLAVFILSLIFGFSSGLAFPMGLIAIIFYLIPMFGPIISAVLISMLLAFNAPLAGLTFLIFYIVYAQLESNIIAPKIQGSGLNLSPVIILASITIGIYTFGLLGAIISIPIAGCIKVLIEEYPRIRDANADTKEKSPAPQD